MHWRPALVAVALLMAIAMGFQAPAARAERETKSYDLVVIGGTPAGIACAVRALCERHSMVTFFNDVDVSGHQPGIAAGQYFGTKGFFPDYDARLGEALKAATGKAWAEGFAHRRQDRLDPNAFAQMMVEAGNQGGKEMTETEFTALLPASSKIQSHQSTTVVSRASALDLMFSLLP